MRGRIRNYRFRRLDVARQIATPRMSPHVPPTARFLIAQFRRGCPKSNGRYLDRATKRLRRVGRYVFLCLERRCGNLVEKRDHRFLTLPMRRLSMGGWGFDSDVFDVAEAGRRISRYADSYYAIRLQSPIPSYILPPIAAPIAPPRVFTHRYFGRKGFPIAPGFLTTPSSGCLDDS